MIITEIIAFIVKYWKGIVIAIGTVIVSILGYHYFISNPNKIDALEADKKELSRQIAAKDSQIKLSEDIQKGKVVINAKVYQNISTLRAEARPRKSVIIRAGRVLVVPGSNKPNTTN
jgi:hypothetical protein